MGTTTGIAALGEVMQLAFVPDDFDAAVKHWTETMGVGPFFLIENIHLDGMKYKGAPTDAVFTLALAYWGDIQIELIRPENDAPDIAKARRVCADQGAEVVIEGKFGSSEVIYVDPGQGTGHLVEILQQDPDGPDLFGLIKQAGENWDGSDPIRTFD